MINTIVTPSRLYVFILLLIWLQRVLSGVGLYDWDARNAASLTNFNRDKIGHKSFLPIVCGNNSPDLLSLYGRWTVELISNNSSINNQDDYVQEELLLL